MKLKLIAILLFLFLADYSFSQDSIPKDTTNIYTKIEKISEKGKFSNFLHGLIFKSNDKSAPKKLEGRRAKSYRRYIGKVIRNIEIEVYDPFGYSFTDTTEVPNSWLEKTGNTLHVKSRKFTIRNLLLFSENSKLDTLLINESARLIRAQNYVRRVEIDPELVSRGSDSVDVRIVVLDAWSIIPKVSLSTSVNRFRLLDRNFVGLGHELRTGVATRLSDGENAWDLRYRIRNFKNTFISSTFSYQARLNESYSKILDIDRPFYSPLARWAGGIYLDEQFSQDSILNMNNELGFERFRYRSFDV
ncbi:MAG: hypothetical protein R3213_07435, partial [Flavobacteriaceae bacterium]|nr:hypothetical protein [Flavobacteriaceae bacterium]